MVLSGCRYSGADLCDDMCDCKGCSSIEYADCVDNADDFERQVEYEGCDGYYDDYMDCASGELACRAGAVDLDGCEREFGRLSQCLN